MSSENVAGGPLGLEDELRALLNRHSAEGLSGTPDYALAGFLVGCLHAFNSAVTVREQWYGRDVSGGLPADRLAELIGNVRTSTMCVCGDNRQVVAWTGDRILFEPHLNRRTGEPCPARIGPLPTPEIKVRVPTAPDLSPMNPFASCSCGDLWLHHDVDEFRGDGSETCCVEGCDQVGCPGRAPAAASAVPTPDADAARCPTPVRCVEGC